jgi:aryl-alcohol dehydrogenase-like predicted oxidoreductase
MRTTRSRAHDIAETGPQYPEERLFNIIDALDVVAKETSKTIPQVAINWLLQQKTVANVIVGARDEKQLLENLGSVGWNLTRSQLEILNKASEISPAYPVWHQQSFPMLNERITERNPQTSSVLLY